MIRDQHCLVSSAVKESSDMDPIYTKCNRSKSNRGGGGEEGGKEEEEVEGGRMDE